jgi:MFS family permease
MLGIKKEAIGATSSTCRDKDYGLICHLYGADSPEARGALSIYIIGFLIGTIYIGFLVSIVAATGIFHPLALAMASGIGSGVMMAAAASTLATIYPEYGDQIIMLAGASDMLAAIVGIYFTLFISLPITKKMYYWLEPKISPKHTRGAEKIKTMKVSG